MRIRNTLTVEELEASEPCLGEPHPRAAFAPVGAARPAAFDGRGDLPPL
jgi:hypothetical protein